MQPDIENFFVEYCHTSLYNNYMRENLVTGTIFCIYKRDAFTVHLYFAL